MTASDRLPVPDFDREVSLDEQLTVADRNRLRGALLALLGPFRLADNSGRAVLEADAPSPAAAGVDVQVEIETVGRLFADRPPAILRGAADLIEAVLLANYRYRMAAELHLAVAESDYEALRTKNTELVASEQRYRVLAESLEQQVREQVTVIEQHQRQMFQSEKLASIGQLAAGVAHEINNPIGFVRANLSSASGYLAKLRDFRQTLGGAGGELLRRWQALDLDFALEDFEALLQESIDGVDRVAAIVSKLRDFAKIDRVGAEPLDVAAAVRSVVGLVQSLPDWNARIELDLAQMLPNVHGLASKFNLMLLKVVENAKLAVPRGGLIAISAAVDAGSLVLKVRDEGCGIPPEVLPRVFDPFFTTREVGSGTGLGLTVSRDIVLAMGGDISINSRVGEGTEVVMRFPPMRVEESGEPE